MNIEILNSNGYFAITSAIWIETAIQAIEQKGRFDVALSGGSTPEKMYQVLAGSPRMKQYWSKVHLWFGDERCVPPDNENSNYHMVKMAMVEYLESVNIHRMAGELAPKLAAQKYAKEMGALSQEDEKPQFDLVMLGIGEDGHIASLFPGSDNYREREAWVAASYVPAVSMWRISITMPVIQAARQVMVLAAGEGKAEIVGKIQSGSGVGLPAGEVVEWTHATWYLDEASAVEIKH